MLRAVPEHWYSNSYTLVEGAWDVARLEASWWSYRAELTFERRTLQFLRDGFFSGPFLLMDGREELGRAVKPSMFYNTFELDFEAGRFTLKKESFLRRPFVVLDGEREIGSIRPEGWLTRRTALDLPDDWPLPERAFAFWLATVIWLREQSAASGGN